MKKVAFRTLGCKVNQAETAGIRSLFARAGFEVVPFTKTADVYIINTCTVTHQGDRKSRQAIRQARKKNKDAVVVVTGCYAQVAPEEVSALPGVSLVVGTHGRERLPELVLQPDTFNINCVVPLTEKAAFESLPTLQAGSRTRAFLKVQEGCRHYCSYCIVPYARGPLFSRSPAEVLEEVQRLAGEGFREVVLSGVNLGAYGTDLTDKQSLAGLIRIIAPVDGIERIRISSIEPGEVTAELVETMLAEPKICRHLHIPLQSGDDEILRRMNRKYTAGEFRRLAEWLHSAVFRLALTTDIMTGFPGEEESHFQRTLELVEQCGFSRLHVFRFSTRRGTPAADYTDQVPATVAEERSRRLAALGEKLAIRYAESFVGEKVKVLFETRDAAGYLSGLTEQYVRVEAPGPSSLRGILTAVTVQEADGAVLRGKIE